MQRHKIKHIAMLKNIQTIIAKLTIAIAIRVIIKLMKMMKFIKIVTIKMSEHIYTGRSCSLMRFRTNWKSDSGVGISSTLAYNMYKLIRMTLAPQRNHVGKFEEQMENKPPKKRDQSVNCGLRTETIKKKCNAIDKLNAINLIKEIDQKRE